MVCISKYTCPLFCPSPFFSYYFLPSDEFRCLATLLSYKTSPPQFKTSSLQFKTSSLQFKTSSLQFKTSSPHFKTSSPQFKTSSLQFKTSSPQFKTSSPQFKTYSPQFETSPVFSEGMRSTSRRFVFEYPGENLTNIAAYLKGAYPGWSANFHPQLPVNKWQRQVHRDPLSAD